MTVPSFDDILSMYLYAHASCFSTTTGGLLSSAIPLFMDSQAHMEQRMCYLHLSFYRSMPYIIHSLLYMNCTLR
ncbi:hypothetical protein BO70DRAFT_222672 [Aspergillus heteromorphus CBS 117.55]|uniref:Uncharacterized protein n=1 Tax=Aspergillus heteromorphus CBS 117.55 TaxID=1448321 RepID=A0A317WJG4_9EURO|nr:uncharacterized protein BO70DRAFT_222672 [Aspergillus heteromorphus CBS 117.55]PWY86195.1 hypothetical protein BO70DRAFT_222672 [Aspergillus heteromorphus CBS 117.55]